MGWSNWAPPELITLLSQKGIGNYSAGFIVKTMSRRALGGVVITPRRGRERYLGFGLERRYIKIERNFRHGHGEKWILRYQAPTEAPSGQSSAAAPNLSRTPAQPVRPPIYARKRARVERARTRAHARESNCHCQLNQKKVRGQAPQTPLRRDKSFFKIASMRNSPQPSQDS